ncbi:MAG: dolichyl-diphosphooligosaccharide--protein glycosyltransferase subunit STT3, partial [Thiovulaceae bacterium]|nr:dolichyl-diphosphooligosaccharide--protein glycosyltransferase subunit STT3 [Sulfurimonadaceae bacterium]
MKVIELIKRHQTAVLIFAALFISISIRLMWVSQFQLMEQYLWNGELLIDSNDGYFFASGAQNALYGSLQSNPRVPDIFYNAVIAVTVLLVKTLPFSLATVIFYLPVVIGSLIIIPIILIGRLYNAPLLGFFAGVLASLSWGYFDRTVAGYFDTDMFSVTGVLFVLFFFLAQIKHRRDLFSLLAALAILLYPFLYDQGRPLIYALSIAYFLYLILFKRHERSTYTAIFLVSTGLLSFSLWAQFATILAFYYLVIQEFIKDTSLKIAALIALLLFLY